MTKKKTLTNLDWIDKRIGLSINLAEDLRKASEVVYEAKHKTPLKLIVIGYYTELYSTLIQKYFDKWMYLDLLAGCGLNLIAGKDHIPGSPFISLSASKKYPFQRMYFVESNPRYCNALSKRLDYIKDNRKEFGFISCNEPSQCIYSVHNESFNDFCISTDFFDNLMEPRTHALVVIDPEGFEIGWNYLSAFLNCRCDVIFSFMTGYIAREWGVAKSNKARNQKSASYNMRTLFGDDSWLAAKKSEDLVDLFRKKIESYNKIVTSIKIRGIVRNQQYDLLIITNPTSGSNPWLNVVYSLKERIEQSGSKLIKDSFDYLKGRRGRLDDHLRS